MPSLSTRISVTFALRVSYAAVLAWRVRDARLNCDNAHSSRNQNGVLIVGTVMCVLNDQKLYMNYMKQINIIFTNKIKCKKNKCCLITFD